VEVGDRVCFGYGLGEEMVEFTGGVEEVVVGVDYDDCGVGSGRHCECWRRLGN